MTVGVRIVFTDGTSRLVGEHDDLPQALAAAFALADRGTDIPTDDGTPERVQVVVDDRVELSIRVLRGGLGAHPGQRR